jgi:hypothetical protein
MWSSLVHKDWAALDPQLASGSWKPNAKAAPGEDHNLTLTLDDFHTFVTQVGAGG